MLLSNQKSPPKRKEKEKKEREKGRDRNNKKEKTQTEWATKVRFIRYTSKNRLTKKPTKVNDKKKI